MLRFIRHTDPGVAAVDLPRITNVLLAGSCMAAFAGLFYVVFVKVISVGICCADDASAAVIAKNFAEGYGYGSSIFYLYTGVPGIVPFDQMVASNGPILVLPAAGLIFLLGNQPWIPGAVVASAILILFAIIAALQFRRAPVPIAAGYMLIFGFLTYALTIHHFEHWFALLGEIPAALLCVTGAMILTASPTLRDRYVAVGSLFFGMAFMCKYLALLGYLPVASWLALSIIRGIPTRKDALRIAFLSTVCFLAPVLSFEIWKLASLGLAGYATSWSKFLHFLSTQSGLTQPSNYLQRVLDHANGFRAHFGISVWVLMILELSVAALVCRTRNRAATILTLLLVSAAMTHLMWWLFISMGWPRYILIGLILHAASLGMVAYVVRSTTAVVLLVLIIIVHVPSPALLWWHPREALATGYREGARVRNLREAVIFLEKYHRARPFASSWWGSVADLEYALPTVSNFQRVDHFAPGDAERDLILVRNSKWILPNRLRAFDAWQKACKEVLFDRPPYLISRCPDQKEALRQLKALQSHPLHQDGPAAKLKIAAAEVRLVGLVPSEFQLDLTTPGQHRLNIGFGLDDNSKPAVVCYSISGLAADKKPLREIWKECSKPAPGVTQTRSLSIPSGLTHLIFATTAPEESDGVLPYWSEMTIRSL